MRVGCRPTLFFSTPPQSGARVRVGCRPTSGGPTGRSPHSLSESLGGGGMARAHGPRKRSRLALTTALFLCASAERSLFDFCCSCSMALFSPALCPLGRRRLVSQPSFVPGMRSPPQLSTRPECYGCPGRFATSTKHPPRANPDSLATYFTEAHAMAIGLAFSSRWRMDGPIKIHHKKILAAR